MRVFFLLKNTYPKGLASTARVHCYGKGFVNQGIETYVLLPIALEKQGTEQKNTKSEGIDEIGVHYQYMSGSSLRSHNFFRRQVNDVYGYLHTLLYIYKHVKKDDQIIVYEGGVLWMIVCAMVAHLKGAKATMELNELPYVTKKQTRKRVFHRQCMLRFAFPRYDQFIVISESLKEIAHRYAPKARIIKVPVMVDLNELANGEQDESPIQEPYIFHAGSLTHNKDGILGMVDAFGKACEKTDKPIKFIMTGKLEDSLQKDIIKQLIVKYQLEDKIRFLGYVEKDVLYQYLRHCSLCIIYKYDNQQNNYCFPNKLGEYLAMSRPVIITNVGEAMNYLEEGKNAYIIPPKNTDLMAEKILDIINHPQIAEQIGKEGRQLAQKEFDCHVQAKRLISFFQSA